MRSAAAADASSSFLLSLTVTPPTAARYRKAVTDFIRWCFDNDEDAHDDAALDNLLCEYFYDLFVNGKGKSCATVTLYGLLWLHPELKHQLPRAAQSVRGWHKQSPGVSYPPLTWELAVAIGVQLARAGQWRHGVGVLLAFDCLLRVGELVGLMREDVADARDLRIGIEHRGVMLRLRKTKTGTNKSVTVLEPCAIALLQQLVAETKPGERLFPFSTDHFRRSMQRACAELGLSPRYVPHSLRHGGATRYSHVFNCPLEDVMERGRWASSKSARTYIQVGVALLMAMEVPPRIGALAAAVARDPVLAFDIVRASVPPTRAR